MVISDLYNGDLRPTEQIAPHSKDYRTINKQIGDILTEFEDKLSAEQMDMVNNLHSLLVDVQSMELEATFEYAFALGLLISRDADNIINKYISPP